MEIQLVKFGYRLYFKVFANLRKVKHVTGVNSCIDDDTHFLMWDFDEVELPIVQGSLIQVQDIFSLSPIHIIKTSKGFHAYCFKSCTFEEARIIIGFTQNVDTHYLALGIGRGYFTLRFTDISEDDFAPVCTIPSSVKPDLDYSDVNCFVKYTKAVV